MSTSDNKKMKLDESKYWCYFIHDYTPADEDHLSKPIDGVEYLVLGRGVGSSGKSHLQGIVCFQSLKRLEHVKAVIGCEAHLTVIKYLLEGIDYCKKDGDFIEWGVPPIVAKKVGIDKTGTTIWSFPGFDGNEDHYILKSDLDHRDRIMFEAKKLAMKVTKFLASEIINQATKFDMDRNHYLDLIFSFMDEDIVEEEEE
jgi:hypothetical protein